MTDLEYCDLFELLRNSNFLVNLSDAEEVTEQTVSELISANSNLTPTQEELDLLVYDLKNAVNYRIYEATVAANPNPNPEPDPEV